MLHVPGQPSLEVVRLNQADAMRVNNFNAQVMDEWYNQALRAGMFMDQVARTNNRSDAQRLCPSLSNNAHVYYGAQDERGELVGLSHLKVVAKGVELYDWFVRKDHRGGSGVGSAVLQAAMNDVKASDRTPIKLEVLSVSPTIRIYEGIGFHACDENNDYEGLFRTGGAHTVMVSELSVVRNWLSRKPRLIER